MSGWSVASAFEDVQSELFEVVGERRCLWVDRGAGHGELRRLVRACRRAGVRIGCCARKRPLRNRYSMHFDAEAIGGETVGGRAGAGR